MHSLRSPRAFKLLKLVPVLALASCALDPMAGSGALTANAAKVYIYTPEEQADMTAEGTPTGILLPSEVRAHFENVRKVPRPTGEVNYCDAGLPQLVQARRNEALAAIAQACGGENKYEVRREGPGTVRARYAGTFQLTPGCTRSKVVVFRCTGVQPKPDMSK